MTSELATDLVRRVQWDSQGLVPVVAQQWDSGQVLMLAWMDGEALRRTVATGRATYWSRSRAAYWQKGETSGNTQAVREIRLDCDGDAIVIEVDQVGPACHTGLRSCFDTFQVALVTGTALIGDTARADGSVLEGSE